MYIIKNDELSSTICNYINIAIDEAKNSNVLYSQHGALIIKNGIILKKFCNHKYSKRNKYINKNIFISHARASADLCIE